MPDFSYQALTDTGEVKTGRITLEDELALEAHLRSRGEYLVRAETVTAPADAESVRRSDARPRSSPRRRRTDGVIPRRDLLAFTEYLWGSAQAGIPILTTLGDLEAQIESKRLRRIIAELREAMVEEGKSLSEALAEHPRAFPALYVGTVEAGETTGQLDYALKQLVDYIEWQREIALHIRQATLYPIIVLAVMAGLVALLLTYVYPRLLPIFTGFGVELPLATRVVMGAGGFLAAYWSWMLIAAALIVLILALIGRTRQGRLVLDSLKLKLPIFGHLIHQLEMARVVTYMALFYRTGIDLIRGLVLLEQMIINQRVAVAIRSAREGIAAGESIAQSFARTGLFPPVVIRSFALGESTGKLDESLERTRAYYAREVPAAVRRMLATLQPLLIVILGGILGMIAMSIFLPIMSIYQSVGR